MTRQPPGGPVLRTVTVGQKPTALVVDAAANRVFVANSGGSSVSVLDATSGALVRTVSVGLAPTALAVDGRAGRAYMSVPGTSDPRNYDATSPGSRHVFDARSGALLAIITSGWNPSTIAVDERSGRVFVVNSSGDVETPGAWAWLPTWARRWLPFLPRGHTQRECDRCCIKVCCQPHARC